MAPTEILVATAALLGTLVFYLTFITYQHRSHINSLRKQGFPMPKGWSWLFGHSLVVLKYTRRLPRDANVLLAMKELCAEFADTELFLLDMWPGYPTSLIVFNPEALHLMSTKWNLPKSLQSRKIIEPIVGGPTVVSMNGPEWKTWRGLLNPGFSAANVNNHVPFIVDSAQIFCDKMRESVGRGIVSLDEYATRLTFDVIMKVTLDSDVGYQRGEHILPASFNTITNWHSFWDIRVLLHPLRPFMQWRHGNIIKDYVGKEISTRYSELIKEDAFTGKKAHSVVSLALNSYISNKRTDASKNSRPPPLDKTFINTTINQVRLFLFAGNDTTSSTIAFCIHALSQNPTARSLMRAEHASIFGAPSTTAIHLKSNPHLLNALSYTTALIKEVLRLYPPSSNLRRGHPDKQLTALNGQLIPTAGLNLICVHQALHTNPRIWVRPNDFLPERWLVGPEHALHPPAHGWRPFDEGSRTCIGLPLAMAEMKVVLVLAGREFDVSPAYGEWDRVQAEKRGLWGKVVRRLWGEELREVEGERAWQSERAGTHPADGYPCRVELAVERK